MIESDQVTGGQIAKGAGWIVFLRWGVRSITFVRTLLLARLLMPADFGLVALAMMLLGVIRAASNLRPDLALVKKVRPERRHYDTAWTLTIIRGALMALVLCLLAGFSSRYFEAPELEGIVYCVAIFVFIGGFQNVGTVDFYKDLTFDKVFWLNFISKVASSVIAITIAIVFRNYWALVAGFAGTRLITVILSFRMHPYRPRLSLAAWREILDFSKWLIPYSIVFSLREQADSFVIGKWLGAAALGPYNLAKTISGFVGTELVLPLRSVMFPAYAKLAQDPDRLRTSFTDSLSLIFAIGAPISIGLGLLAEPFVHVVLGQNWLGAIPLIEVLVFYALFQLCNSPCSALFLAVGKTHIMFVAQVIGMTIAIPSIFYGLEVAGIYGVALAVAITSFVTTLFSLTFAIKFTQLRLLAILCPIGRSIGALAIMTASVLLVSENLPVGSELIWRAIELLALSLVGAVGYTVSHFVLWRLSGKPHGPELSLLTAIQTKLSIGSAK